MATSPIRLDGRVAIVTGGGSGVGAATCAAMAEAGAAVAVIDVNLEGAQAVASQVRGEAWGLDVTDRSAWHETVAAIVDRFGGIDIVHLNAGIMARPVRVSMADDPLPWLAERVDAVLDVNAMGVANGVIASLEALIERQGHIVVTASVAGLTPLPQDPAYAMSKHGVIGLVRSLGPTLAERGVSISAVCPGGIDTPMSPDEIKAVRSLAAPSFIADAVVQIISQPDAGGIWVAHAPSTGVWPYTFAPATQGPPT